MDFNKWFIQQFGKRKSRKPLYDLKLDAQIQDDKAYRARLLLEQVELWENQRQAARYAYNAFKEK
jgi:hypothetical protein